MLKWALAITLVCGGLVATAYFLTVLPENGFSALWTWFNDFGVAITALATIATAIIAIQALRAAARDSADRSRPIVIAEFQLAEESDTSCDLIICNYGQSLAKNVVVKFSDDLESGVDDEERAPGENLRRRYENPIGVLSPNHQLRNTWWFGIQPESGSDAAKESRMVNGNALPDQVTISISYTDLQGTTYSDEFELDTRTMLFSTSAFASTSMRGRATSMAKSLSKIAKSYEPSSQSQQPFTCNYVAEKPLPAPVVED